MKNKKFLFSCLKKGQVIFCIISFMLAITSSFILESATKTYAINGGESINFVVVLDPGHGGLDPGSIGYKTKVKESDVNLSVAKILEQKLKQIGITVVMTRSTVSGLYGLSTTNYKKRDMAKRKEIIEMVNPDMVVSVHMNSYIRHNLRGAQVFYNKESEISSKLANSIQQQFESRLEASNKGVSVGDYYMLNCTDAPSVIAECGFLSNEEDEKLLTNKEYQEKIADCILVGIVNFLNQS